MASLTSIPDGRVGPKLAAGAAGQPGDRPPFELPPHRGGESFAASRHHFLPAVPVGLLRQLQGAPGLQGENHRVRANLGLTTVQGARYCESPVGRRHLLMDTSGDGQSPGLQHLAAGGNQWRVHIGT